MSRSHGMGSAKAAMAIAGLSVGVAAGAALGTYIIAPNLPGGSAETSAATRADAQTAEKERDIAVAQADSADSYIGSLTEKAVSGALTDTPVIVVRTSSAEDEDVAAVGWLLKKAGALDGGTITLEEKFFAQDSADALKNIVTSTLPAGAQLSVDQLEPGTHAGEAMGAALVMDRETGQPFADVQDRALLLTALKEAGFIDFQSGTIRPAPAVVLITGDADGGGQDSESGFVPTQQAHFARALHSQGMATVVAGRINSAADSGLIGQLREDDAPVSTVDSISREYGRLATVLAVAEAVEGGSGAYGSAASAEAAGPAAVVR